jgi:error-prone DNA polymerase
MNENAPYTPLHISSCYSFGYGLLTPQRICREAKQRGHRAVALADRHNFYGMVRFLRAAEREGIKPILGMTLLREGKPACTAYVLDRRGFVRLNRLASKPPGADPLPDLLSDGWDGLALVSEDRSVLRSLLSAGSRGLYVQLTYGRPFRELLRLSAELDLRPLAVNQALFFEPEEAAVGDLLRSISLGCTVERLPLSRRMRPESRLVGRAEMERFFSALPEALDSARALAEQACCDGLLPRAHVFPRYRNFSEEQSFRLLRRLCYRSARLRGARLRGAASAYHRFRNGAGPAGGEPARGFPPAGAPAPKPDWQARLEHELRVIRSRGFAGYFLVVREILQGCSLTCGRGSSAASLVSYLLGITQVDPLRYNLDFDRFLNDQRVDPPDIDVDFPWDERDAVLRRVFSRYRGRVAMVADHVTFGPRSAMREAAKAYGLPVREIEKMVRFYRCGEHGRIPSYLLEAAEAVRGLPRHMGTHCGGVVITPGPISDYTHVRSSPLGYPVMAWDRDGAAAARLVKIDLLGNRSLAVLRDTLKLAGVCPPDLTVLRDEPTGRMIARGDTVGLFYVESPACRQLLRKMGRGDYEHLIIAGSIIRPAANATIRRFLQRLHGAPYRCPADVLAQSYGLMVYQEDIGRVTAATAAFPPALADRLRKYLRGNNGSVGLEAYRRLFFSRGRRNGTRPAVLEELWEMICSFRGYSFCKAHSASYALVSYKLAYLKRHFPLQFFLSVINNGGGYYSRQTYLNECRRLGIPLLLPDVNRSRLPYTAEEGGIRVGLGQIRSISRRFVERLLSERRRAGPFADPADLFKRLSPTLLEIRILVRSGALDGIANGLARPQLLWSYLRRGGGQELFAQEPPSPADYPEEQKLLDELRTMGLMISRHPVSLFRSTAEECARKLRFPALIRSSELPRYLGLEVSLVGLVAGGKEVLARPGAGRSSASCRAPGTLRASGAPAASGSLMVFITLEDELSLFEAVLFPGVLSRCRHSIDGGGVLLLCGRVEQEMGALSVTVRRLSRLGIAAGGRCEVATPSRSAAGVPAHARVF